MPDLRGHRNSDGNRIGLAYEETRDVKTVTDYIKRNAKYKDVPVIVMGVSMGGAVAIRSIGENKDIDALVSLSAFSSLEDFLQTIREALLPMVPAKQLNGVTGEIVRAKFHVDSSVSSPFYALRGLNNRPVLMMNSRKIIPTHPAVTDRYSTTPKVEYLASMLLRALIVVDAHEEYVASVFGYLRGIFLALNLVDGSVGCMIELQLDN